MANIAANMGAKYRSDTAVPTGRYLIDIKNKVIEVTPTIPLITNSFLLFPKIGILFFKRNPKVKKSDPADLKNTIWCGLISTRYFTTIFMQAKENVLITMNFMVLLIAIDLSCKMVPEAILLK